MADVNKWLMSIGLEQYSDSFFENDIDFQLLSSLDHEVLQAIGVKSAGHRMKILKAAATLEDISAEPESRDNLNDANVLQHTPNEAEHRQLTVMFCDLADSTALSGRLDTETYRDLILAYQELCTRCIERYEGYVARIFGDGLLVYFGYPLAHEDETQRAIHSGLEILEELKDLNSQQANQDITLAARIGISTGPVVVGDIIGDGASQESAVIGETPNIAARLQALAEPNQIIVSPSTKNLAAGEFVYQSMGEQTLKGVERPLEVWSVQGDRAHDSRFDATRGLQITPLVGRDEERDILVRRWQRASNGSGQVVLISGEAGIGKSRLSRGLREQLADQPHIALNYQCSPFHVSSALHPVINQLERAASFSTNDDHDTKYRKLEQLLSQSTDDIATSIHHLAELLSIPGNQRFDETDISPIQLKDQTLQILVRQLEGLSKNQPVLMVFEDLHWADPTTLELLDLIVDKVAQIPVMLLATHRPDFKPPWTGEAQVYSITLNKLDPNNSTALIEGVTGGLLLPPEVLAEIITKTDGVPLFVEELTKTVIESGMLRQEDSRYVLEQPFTSLAIPSTLKDSLMARLDRLGLVKEIAQIGAVIGREFGHELIHAVAGLEDSILTERLEKLAEAGLVLKRGTPPFASYLFKHALIQDISYASLLKSKKQLLHGKISKVLIETFPDLIETQPELAAHHLSEAGLISEAIKYWHLASELASSRAAPEEAYIHLGLALEGLKQLPESNANLHLRLQLLGQRVTPTIATSSYGGPKLKGLIADAMTVYARLDEPSEQIFLIIYAQWASALTSGRTIDAPGIAVELLNEARRQKDDLKIILGYRISGCGAVMMGQPRESLDFLEKALSVLGDRQSNEIGFAFGQDSMTSCYTYSAMAHGVLGNFEKMYEFSELAIAQGERTKNPLTLGYLYGHLCLLFSEIRDLDYLSRSIDRLGSLLRDHPMPNWIPMLEYSRAVKDSYDLGNNLVVGEIRNSMELMKRLGFFYWHPIFETNLARIYLARGEIEQA
ncbi:MAG: class 3 adenylate cyclase, partial [Gammaproteobacteria bacterium]